MGHKTNCCQFVPVGTSCDWSTFSDFLNVDPGNDKKDETGGQDFMASAGPVTSNAPQDVAVDAFADSGDDGVFGGFNERIGAQLERGYEFGCNNRNIGFSSAQEQLDYSEDFDPVIAGGKTG
ncbi:MAG: hypothetical protein AAGA74_06740 [Pseudomonadota bacterium]